METELNWTMIGATGTWVAGLATFLAAFLSMHYAKAAKRTTIHKHVLYDEYKLTIRLFNKSPYHVSLEHAYLVTKKRDYSRNYICEYYTDYAELLAGTVNIKNNDGKLSFDKSLIPNGAPLEITISYNDIFRDYIHYIPFEGDFKENGFILNKYTEMNSGYILLVLNNGDEILAKLPYVFYDRFINFIAHYYEIHFRTLLNSESQNSGSRKSQSYIDALMNAHCNSYRSSLFLYKKQP